MFPGPLRVFHEAVNSGSIRKASEKLDLAPSSVSRQVLILERQFGTALFDRSVSGLRLTRAGEIVADYARSVLLGYDSIKSDIDDIRGTHRGYIRISAVEGGMAHSAVAAIAAFRSTHKEVNFRVNMRPAPAVIEAIKRGEADIGLTFCGNFDADIKYESRVKDPIVLAVPLQHVYAKKKEIPFSALSKLDLAMPEPNFGTRRILDEISRRNKTVLNPVLSSDSFVALRTFAMSGAGATILPRLAVSDDVRGKLLKAVQINEPELANATIDIITLNGRRLSTLLRRFLVELKKTLAVQSI